MGERDKSQEDRVAKLFEKARSDLKIEKLTRIKHRDELEQTVCTRVLKGAFPQHASTNTSAYYQTAQPDSISPELYKIASFKDRPLAYTPAERYSVAVWRTKDSQTGEIIYWVGVQLYWSAATEFFDY